MKANFVLSERQGELLCERIYRRLAGIDPIWMAATSFDRSVSYNRLSETHEELTFLVKDLANVCRSAPPSTSPGASALPNDRLIEVSTPPAVVREVLERLRTEAEGLHPEIDLRDDAAENRELIDVCNELLVSLQGQTSPAGTTPVVLSAEDRLAQKEVLRAVLESAPHPLNPVDSGSSISERIGVPLDAVSHALHELHGMGLVVSEGAGVAASEGLTRVSQLWENLSEII